MRQVDMCQYRRMDAIKIRLATPDDAHAVAGYHDRCIAHSYAAQVRAGELKAPDIEGMERQLGGWFEPGSGFVTHVADVDGEPIGHFTVYGHQLVHLFVEPKYQGIGLGRRLLELAEQMMVAEGHTQFELHTRVDNFAAIAFYKMAGWNMTDRVINTVELDISYDEHVFVKQRSID